VRAVKIVFMVLCPEILTLIEQIRSDKTHGASELARQALKAMQTLADISRASEPDQFWLEIKETADLLKSVRPSMAPITNVLDLLIRSVSESIAPDVYSLRVLLRSEADRLVRLSQQAAVLIANYTAAMMVDGESVMTHSYSSTVTAAIIASCTGHGVKAVVTRSGAGRTGIRTAAELSKAGVPVTYIDDTAAGILVRRVSKVLVGADRVCCDGSLVNGAGTSLIAMAASQAGVPFFVLCETLKFDRTVSGSNVELEEKDSSEVISPGTLDPAVEVKNPYFDITPPHFITAFITEKGLINPLALKAFLACSV
jgi:ribose 1,5-bisphosphate isomerase